MLVPFLIVTQSVFTLLSVHLFSAFDYLTLMALDLLTVQSVKHHFFLTKPSFHH